MAVTVTPGGSSAVANASTANPVTFSSLSFSTATADRIIVACINERIRNSATGVTIGGVAATLAVAELLAGTFPMSVEIWYAPVPTGTSGDVVVTYPSADSGYFQCSVFAVYGASGGPNSVGNNSGTGLNSIGVSMTVPTGGALILSSGNGGNANTVAWTNATEHADAGGDDFLRSSSAYSTTAGTATRTCDGGDNEPYAIVGATWQAALATGSANVTLGSLTTAATGAVRVAGVSNQTLGALTTAAAGVVRVAGSADITLGALTVAATGTGATRGTADITLGALTTLATGAVAVAGSGDVTLGALATDAAGTVAVAGAADITLGDLTVQAEGTVGAALSAQADITLGDLVVTATGQVVVTGSVDAVLGALTVEASSSGDASSKPIRRRKKYLYIPPEELTPAEVKQLYREARQEIPVRVQGGLLTLAPDLFRNRSERELPALSRLSITKLRQEIDLLRSLQAELADIEHTRALKAEQDYEAALRRQVKKDFEDEDDAIIFAISELGP